MNTLITADDIDYLAGQSADNMNMILSGMTALLDENNAKAEMLGAQTWFQRMSKTISGKNKLTLAEIQQNQDKINLYVTQAMSELFERNCIDQQIMMSLGTRLNELYADHIQLKQMLGAFAEKLNQKLVSIDNFHMLETEIEQGVYDRLMPIAAMCKVLSQLDIRTLNDSRKLDILERSLRERGILSEEPIGISECLMGMLDTSGSEVWLIYMELECLKGNFIVDVLKQPIEHYHFLSEMAKRMKRKERIVSSIIQQNQLDDSAELTSEDIYHEFLDAKIMAAPQIGLRGAGCTSVEEVSGGLGDAIGAFLKCDKDGITNLLEPLAEQEDGLALYLLSFTDWLGMDVQVTELLERGYIAGNPMAAVRYAKRCEDADKGAKIINDNIDAIKEMAAQGDMFAQYEYAMLCSSHGMGRKFEIRREGVDVRELLHASSDQGNWTAACQLATQYRWGWDGEADSEKAFRLFFKLNQMNVFSATMELADFYAQGIFVNKNAKKAVELYRKSYEGGCLKAGYDLARCYQHGLGVYQDKKKARKLYDEYLEKFEKELMDEYMVLYTSSIALLFDTDDEEAKKEINKIIYPIKVNKTSADAAYQESCLCLEEEDMYYQYLFVAAKCGNPYALYECAKCLAVRDFDEYCETYPDSPYIDIDSDFDLFALATVLPYDLEVAQYYLEQAKELTNDEKLINEINQVNVKIIKAQWSEVRQTFRDTLDLFRRY